MRRPQVLRRRDVKPRMSWGLVLDSFMLGTAGGHTLLLIAAGTFLVTAGAGFWMAAGAHEDCKSPVDLGCAELANHTDFYESMFFSYGLFFDPGTQMGLHPGAPPAHKAVVIIFSILGFIFNLVVLGLIVEVLRVRLDRWQRLYRRVIANGHVVVLGWTDKTLFLLEEQARLLKDSKSRGGTIVVLGELDTREMREEVAVTFPDWRTNYPGVKLVYRQGKPCEARSCGPICPAAPASAAKRTPPSSPWPPPPCSTHPHG